MPIPPEFLDRVKCFNTKILNAIEGIKDDCVDDEDHKAFQGGLLLLAVPIVAVAKRDDKELYKIY